MTLKEIQLTNGLYAKVDADKYNECAKYKWHISHGYAATHIKSKSKVYLHNFVSGLSEHSPESWKITKISKHTVDHINRDRLDNSSANLRYVPHFVNMLNRSTYTDKPILKTSKYKWVALHKRTGLYRVIISNRHICQVSDETEAAKIADSVAHFLYGDFINYFNFDSILPIDELGLTEKQFTKILGYKHDIK